MIDRHKMYLFSSELINRLLCTPLSMAIALDRLVTYSGVKILFEYFIFG